MMDGSGIPDPNKHFVNFMGASEGSARSGRGVDPCCRNWVDVTPSSGPGRSTEEAQ